METSISFELYNRWRPDHRDACSRKPKTQLHPEGVVNNAYCRLQRPPYQIARSLGKLIFQKQEQSTWLFIPFVRGLLSSVGISWL
ncbi:MAG: hypothetical protein ACOX9C_03305 [Kiritimatiellia bacterium]